MCSCRWCEDSASKKLCICIYICIPIRHISHVELRFGTLPSFHHHLLRHVFTKFFKSFFWKHNTSLVRIAMTTILSSEAVFDEKAAECGIPDPALAEMKRQNIRDLGTLAFSAGQPGQVATDDMLTRLVTVGGAVPNLGTLGSVRRLVFMAQSLAIADMKQQVEGSTEGQKKELAPAEREARIIRQKARLVGLTLGGESECAHSCYDHVLTMVEKNTIVYLDPSKFPSRRAELSNEKQVKEITLDASKSLKLSDRKQDVTCDTHTELLLIQALQRRALALDLVGAATYSSVEQYNSFLTMHLQTDPPPGYAKISVAQILQADRRAWMRLAEKLASGIRRKPDNSLPLNGALGELENDPRVTFYLLPLPISEAKRSHADAIAGSASVLENPINKALKGGKGKKGKGKSDPNRPPKNLPHELQGKVTTTKTGKRICWNYNLPQGCQSGVRDGQACDRGLHLCAEPKCGRPHSMQHHLKGGS